LAFVPIDPMNEHTKFEVRSFTRSRDNRSKNSEVKTRKLSYCQDDRVMHIVCGCPENYQESMSTPMATFPEILNWLLFRSIL